MVGGGDRKRRTAVKECLSLTGGGSRRENSERASENEISGRLSRESSRQKCAKRMLVEGECKRAGIVEARKRRFRRPERVVCPEHSKWEGLRDYPMLGVIQPDNTH